MSSCPNSSTAFLTSSSGTPSLVRSPAKTAVSPLISLAASSATSPSRSLMSTRAPCSVSSSAVARPIPRAEPVTIAAFPSSTPMRSQSPLVVLAAELYVSGPNASVSGKPFRGGKHVERGRLVRYAPLAGVVWAVAVIASFFVIGDTPDTKSSTAKVVKYWADHDTEQIAGSLILAVGLIFFVWFAGSLRSALRAAEGAVGRLSAISFGGAILFASGGIVSLSLTFAVADTVGDVPPLVTQSLFILSDDVWLWAPIGMTQLMFPPVVVACRTGFLPKWLAWLSALILVLFVTPIAFFGLLASQLWILGVSIMLFRRGGQAPAPPPPATAAA